MKVAFFLLSLFLGSWASAQLTVFTATDGEWNDSANWTLNTLPTPSNTVVLNATRKATISNGAAFAGTFVMPNTPTTVELDIFDDFSVNSHRLTSNIGQTTTTTSQVCLVNLYEGVYSVGTSLEIASSANGGTNPQGTFRVFGGEMDFSGVTANVGTQGTGILAVHGSDGSINGASINLGSGGLLEFNFAGAGVSPVSLSNTLTIDSSSQLVINAEEYSGDVGVVELVTFGSHSGNFAMANVLVNLPGVLEGAVIADMDSLNLVITAGASTTITFTDATGDGLWENAGNWSLGAIPQKSNQALITSGMAAILEIPQQEVIEEILIGDDGNVDNRLTLRADMGARTLTIAEGVGAQGEIVHEAGTMTVLNAMNLSSTSSGSGVASYQISGGRLNAGNATVNVGAEGQAVLTLEGSSVDAEVGHLNLGDNGKLAIVLGETGFSPLQINGELSVASTSVLEIDGMDYRGGTGDIVLANFSSNVGSFNSGNIALTNFPGSLTGAVQQVGGQLLLTLSFGPVIDNIFTNASGDFQWTNPTNWSLGSVPEGAEQVILNNGQEAVLDSTQEAVVQSLIIGNSPMLHNELTIQSDLFAFDVLVASADGSSGTIVQESGDVKVANVFEISSTQSTSQNAVYQISGGSLEFENTTLEVGLNGDGLLVVSGSDISSLSGNGLEIGAAGVVQFTLDFKGVTPIQLEGNLTLDSGSSIVLDGTDYEGWNGYFPLIQYDSLTGVFDPAEISFIGLEEREPTVLYEDDGIYLRLNSRPDFSERLTSLIPESTVVFSDDGSSFELDRSYRNSASAWGSPFSEPYVMDALLKNSNGTGRDWDLRIGRGGQIYSFRSDFTSEGTLELIPPQTTSSDQAPWNDEVWQMVAVDTSLNDVSDVNPADGIPDSPYFIHQAGVYTRDPEFPTPFYSPQVAYKVDEENRSYTTINWGVQAHVQIYNDDRSDNDWQSQLLYITRFKDLGDGVIELTQGMYNYGNNTLSFINAPWGGVRRTSMEYAFVTDTTGSPILVPSGKLFGPLDNDVDRLLPNTDGWMAHSHNSDGTGASLALVLGQDPVPLLSNQYANTLVRNGYAAGTFSTNETNWRNYYVTEIIRRYNLTSREGLWCRSYFVLGDSLNEVQSKINLRGINSGVEMSAFSYSEETSPLIGYTFTGSDSDFRISQASTNPLFFLYAHPVSGSLPIYDVVEDNGQRYLSSNPYQTGVTKVYDGTIVGMRLLGFAIDTSDESVGNSYETLDSIFSGVVESYLPSGQSLSVRVNQTALEAWRVEHFGFMENSGLAGNLEDPEGDGINNLTEYAFGGNPLERSDGQILPSLTQSLNGEWSYQFFRRINGGLTYDLESSTTLMLNDWTPFTGVESVENLNAFFDEVSIELPLVNESHLFLRLEISEE